MAIGKQFTTDRQEPLSEEPRQWLTDEEALAVLDFQARRRLKMSGEEFLRRWRADDFTLEYKDEHHSDFVFLHLMATPFGR